MPAPIDPATRRASLRLLALACAALGLVPLLFPGDAPWINDEPLFLERALQGFAAHGLVGTRGVVYGPFAIWVYAALLRLSHDLVVLVALRALLCTALTVVAILWLARLSPRLRPALGAIALLSPYLWLYSRQLWDNTFLIPLSAIALCAYVSFCLRPRPAPLWLTTLCCTFMFLLHLMSLALVVPIALHLLLTQRRWLRAHLGTALGQVALAAALCVPYLVALARSAALASQQAARLVGTASAARPPLVKLDGWVFPLLGGRLLSAQGIDYFFGAGWGNAAIRAVAALTAAALPLVWLGAYLAARLVRQGRREPAARDADHYLSILCLGAVGAQIVLDGVMQSFGHPHYYNATWPCFLYLLWLALSALPRAIGAGLAAALGAVLAFLIVDVHRSAGNRDIHYGTTVGHQIEIARRLHRYDPSSPVRSTMQNYALFPHALTVLRRLHGLEGTPGGPRRALLIRPLRPEGRDGWLTVEEVAE